MSKMRRNRMVCLARAAALGTVCLSLGTGCLMPLEQAHAKRTLEALRKTGQARACYRTEKARGFPVTELWLSTMIDGLFDLDDDGKKTEAWQRCMTRIFTTLDADEASVARTTILHQLNLALRSKRGKHASGLSILHELLLATDEPVAVDALVQDALAGLVTTARGKREDRLVRAHDAWRQTLDLLRGHYEGEVLTERKLKSIDDEPLLLRFARLLPAAGMRELSQRRVVQLRLSRSGYDELADREAEIIDAVMTQGYWSPPLDEFVPESIEVTPGVVPARGVLHAGGQFRHYLVSPVLDERVAREQPIDLGAGLQLQLRGLSKPVRLCRAGRELDPTPCLPSNLLEPALGRWEGTKYHLSRPLAVRDAVQLSASGLVPIAFEIAGRSFPLATIPVTLEVPRSMRFVGARGEPGPHVRLRISKPTANLFLFEATARERNHFALVLAELAPKYRVISEGGEGAEGSPGAAGRPGRDGRDGAHAVCPDEHGESGEDGEDGEPGGAGGPGGSGGDGGDIEVLVARQYAKELATVAVSRGGAGGPGGPGGPGGRGGRGGSAGASASCDDNSDDDDAPIAVKALSLVADIVISAIASSSDGADGRDGEPGQPGIRGPDGRPGRIIGLRPADAPTRREAPIAAQRVLVMQTRRLAGVEGRVVDLYTEALLSAVHERGRLEAVGASDVHALLDLERQRDLVGCDDVTCLAEIAGALDVDYLLRSSIGRVGDRLAVHLALIHQQRARVLVRREQMYDSEEHLIAGAQALVVSLLE